MNNIIVLLGMVFALLMSSARAAAPSVIAECEALGMAIIAVGLTQRHENEPISLKGFKDSYPIIAKLESRGKPFGLLYLQHVARGSSIFDDTTVDKMAARSYKDCAIRQPACWLSDSNKCKFE